MLNVDSVARNRTARPAEVHLFLIWHNALDHAADILTHVERRFGVLEVVDVEWSQARFAENLTRFYRDMLPPGSDKERHCGVGPFRLIVVEDVAPRHARRRTSRGSSVVNARMFDARKKYRSWTGGGHRVHGSLTTREADHDLFLLLGRRAGFYQGMKRGERALSSRRRAHDLLGADGWESMGQLLTALDVTVDSVVLPAAREAAADSLELLVGHRWWAAVTANAWERGAQFEAGEIVRIGSGEVRLRLRSPDDDPVRKPWLEEVLRRRVPADEGYVLGPVDEFYVRLWAATMDDSRPSPGAVAELDRLATAHSLPRGDYSDRRFAESVLDEVVASTSREGLHEHPGKRRLPFLRRYARRS